MIDYYNLRQDLEDVYLKIYYKGCNAALVEIARIHTASEIELEEIAIRNGFDLQKWSSSC